MSVLSHSQCQAQNITLCKQYNGETPFLEWWNLSLVSWSTSSTTTPSCLSIGWICIETIFHRNGPATQRLHGHCELILHEYCRYFPKVGTRPTACSMWKKTSTRFTSSVTKRTRYTEHKFCKVFFFNALVLKCTHLDESGREWLWDLFIWEDAWPHWYQISLMFFSMMSSLYGEAKVDVCILLLTFLQ